MEILRHVVLFSAILFGANAIAESSDCCECEEDTQETETSKEDDLKPREKLAN